MKLLSKCFNEVEIANFSFFEECGGVFCFKKDDNGVITDYAHISSSYELILTKDLLCSNCLRYNWYDNDPNKQIESRREICLFIGEIAFRLLLIHGKPYEQEKAKTYWQIYNPQSLTPEELITNIRMFIEKPNNPQNKIS